MHHAIFVAVLVASVPASAEPPGLVPPITTPSAPDPVDPVDRESYRGELVALDGLSVLALITVPPLGLGTYVLSAPIDHERHGHTGRALTSLALRIGVPTALGYLAWQDTKSDDEGFIVVGMGILGGMALASLIDIAVLGGPDDAPRPPRIAPTLARSEGATMFGLSGTF
jgi:hypothetical protein